MPAGTARQDNLTLCKPYRFRLHNFKCGALFQYPILMDTGTVGKCISTNYRLIGLNHYSRNMYNQPARLDNLLSMDTGNITPEQIMPGLQCHNELFNRGIACPLSYAVYSALYLPGSIYDGCQVIGCRQSKVIMAVHANLCLFYIGYLITNISYQPSKFFRDSVADCVRYIYRRSTC